MWKLDSSSADTRTHTVSDLDEIESQGEILVVDDELDNLKFFSTVLCNRGYRVRQATSGEVAMRAVRLEPPNLILLDIMMPQMDGYEVCRQFKTDLTLPDIPIIFMSALGNGFDKAKAFNVGGVDYITKPVQVEEAIARIEHQLTIRRLQTQLQKKNRSLEQTLDRLKKTQVKLIEREKMSGLGTLVAGIAHEMNNPANFIYGNIDPASEYARDLFSLLELYQHHYPQPVPEIEEAIEALDLEYIQEDFPKLLQSLNHGASRIRDIVTDLRCFASLDCAPLKIADFHRGLESTLQLLQHRLRATNHRPEIEVRCEFDRLPPLEYYPAQLNQVFWHLLNNAIDAIETRIEKRALDTKFRSPPPLIDIRTTLLDRNWVEIRIADNGVGIPKNTQTRIFEPFFTTKLVGAGMGLGLATSYSIVVEQHGGNLEFETQVDGGTEFIVQLPVTRQLRGDRDRPSSSSK
ncbi:MAG: hybrid sensor histidine kinase/response regulator [Cyanobacteriota bacterium]|nr:hybrid sensor histidine kinase/response regulator [Cyanobacteriota bacterium]